MFAKLILVATLALAGTSLTFLADASAASPWRQGGPQPYHRGQSPLCPADHSYHECFYLG
jgi:hypothetical protein